MRRLVVLQLILTLVPVSASVEAHKLSDSYLNLTVSGATIEGQLDIALRDIDYAIGIDENDDGAITWGELRGRHEAIKAYALSRFQIQAAGAACAIRPLSHLVDYHSDGAYEILRFTANCPYPAKSLEITYTLFFDFDPQHRCLLRLDYPDGTQTAIFSPERSTRRFELGVSHPWRQFFDYGREGIWHIWIGFDHILFLLTLLLPAVLQRQSNHWEAVQGIGKAFLNVFKIVTAFTVAHSITLSLASLGVFALPARFIESMIAASVVFAALNNLFPVITRRLWIVAFAFGLVHGLGFANVLKDFGLPQGILLLALFGFNFGVEIGQLAIVSIFIPFAYGLRSWRFYPRVALKLGSLVIAAIASVWLIERAFNFASLLP